MSTPESFLSAAKKVADAAHIPWSSEASKVYRDLQQGDWLPKSAGRRVYAAHPNLIAVFLIGLAAPTSMLTPTAAVELFAVAKRDEMEGDLRDVIGHLASHPAPLDDVEFIEFFAHREEAVITYKSGRKDHFFPLGAYINVSPRLINHHGVISGDLLRHLRGAIAWAYRGHLMTDADIEEDV